MRELGSRKSGFFKELFGLGATNQSIRVSLKCFELNFVVG